MEKKYKFYDKKNLGYKRHELPQIDEDSIDEFLIYFAGKVKVSKLKMALDRIKPTQDEINEDKVKGMIDSGYDWKGRIYIVSSDNYLLDGHHGYAMGLEEDPDAEVTVYRINIPMKQLIARSNKLKITHKVDVNDDLVKSEMLCDLIEKGHMIVTDLALEEQLEYVYEEFGFEKAIPTHLVKKVIVNKEGHTQTVYIDPNKDNKIYDFHKHPYTGTHPVFAENVTNAVKQVLESKGEKLKLVTKPYDSKVAYITAKQDGSPNEAAVVEWYKTKNFNKTGVIGIKHGGKIHEKKIANHEDELAAEKEYLENIDIARKKGQALADKIEATTSGDGGLQNFGGFSVGDHVTFEDAGEKISGKITGLKYHEKYDKFGTAIVTTEDGKKYSRSLKKVQFTAVPVKGVEAAAQKLAEAMKGNQNAKKDTTTVSKITDNLKFIQSLGGSNGAQLLESEDGKHKYVVKTLKNEVAQNEANANWIYKSFGIAVPDTIHVGDKLLTTYIPNTVNLKQYLASATIIDTGKIYKQIKDGFVADALLGNWDVVGLDEDNMVVDPATKKLYRIDNGGALFYRAQGAAKGDEFKDTVIELDTLRDPKKNPQTAKFFKGVTDADIAAQVKHILENKAIYLQYAAILGGDKEQKMLKRLSYLETKYNTDIKPSAKAEGYHKNGLYKKTGIEKIDNLYDKIDEAMALTEADYAFIESDTMSSDRSGAKNLAGVKDGASDMSTWVKKALQAGATPLEMYCIQMYTGGSYKSMNDALVNVTNVQTANINPDKLIFKKQHQNTNKVTHDVLVQANVTKHPKDVFYQTLLDAAKTVNHHKEDKQYNMAKITALKAQLVSLDGILKDVEKNKTKYNPSDVHMMQYYFHASKNVLDAKEMQKEAPKVAQYELTGDMHKKHNAFVEKLTSKNKKENKPSESLKINTKLDALVSNDDKRWLARVKLLTSGLAKLEKHDDFHYKGNVYRKITAWEENEGDIQAFKDIHHEHANVIWQRNNSTSKKSSTWSGDIKFEIKQHLGVDVQAISHHDSEEEVMLKPFTCIKVNKVSTTAGGSTFYEVEQLG